MNMKMKLKSIAGVTMVELMVMAVIVGVVASMAVPRFDRAYQQLQFRSANRDIVSTLRLARSMSIADKLQYGVHIDYDTRTLILFQDITSPDLFTYSTGDRLVRVDTLKQEVEYIFSDLADNTITFGPNGSAGFNGGGNITSMKSGDGAYLEGYHNVLRSTGRVKSYDSWAAWAAENGTV